MRNSANFHQIIYWQCIKWFVDLRLVSGRIWCYFVDTSSHRTTRILIQDPYKTLFPGSRKKLAFPENSQKWKANRPGGRTIYSPPYKVVAIKPWNVHIIKHRRIVNSLPAVLSLNDGFTKYTTIHTRFASWMFPVIKVYAQIKHN